MRRPPTTLRLRRKNERSNNRPYPRPEGGSDVSARLCVRWTAVQVVKFTLSDDDAEETVYGVVGVSLGDDAKGASGHCLKAHNN